MLSCSFKPLTQMAMQRFRRQDILDDTHKRQKASFQVHLHSWGHSLVLVKIFPILQLSSAPRRPAAGAYHSPPIMSPIQHPLKIWEQEVNMFQQQQITNCICVEALVCCKTLVSLSFADFFLSKLAMLNGVSGAHHSAGESFALTGTHSSNQSSCF